jgi:hypothetical protein
MIDNEAFRVRWYHNGVVPRVTDPMSKRGGGVPRHRLESPQHHDLRPLAQNGDRS